MKRKKTKNSQIKTIELVKKWKYSLLTVIFIASITYAGVSLIGKNTWTWWGQILSPLLGIVVYIIIKRKNA